MVDIGHDKDDSLDQSESGPTALLLSALRSIYDHACEGGYGFSGAEDVARDYMSRHASVDEAIDSLIRWQVGKASTAGFVSNLGGLITLPVAIPANLAVVVAIQFGMITAIASMRGYDLKSDQVRTFCYACLVGGGVTDLLKDVGVQIGSKFAAKAIQSISGATLRRINQAVGFRLITKAGTTGAVNLGKLIPFFGGLVGGTIDGITMVGIGTAAKQVFPMIEVLIMPDETDLVPV